MELFNSILQFYEDEFIKYNTLIQLNESDFSMNSIILGNINDLIGILKALEKNEDYQFFLKKMRGSLGLIKGFFIKYVSYIEVQNLVLKLFVNLTDTSRRSILFSKNSNNKLFIYR